MPEDRTPMDHGLAHPQPERGTIPQPEPQAGDDERELVPNQRSTEQQQQPQAKPGADGSTDFMQQPD